MRVGQVSLKVALAALALALLLLGASVAVPRLTKSSESSHSSASISESNFADCELPATVCAPDLGPPQIKLEVEYFPRIPQGSGREFSLRLRPLKGDPSAFYKSVLVNLDASSDWSFAPDKHIEIPVTQKRSSIILASCSDSRPQKILINAELIPRSAALKPRPLANTIVLEIEILPEAVIGSLTEEHVKLIQLASAALGLPALLLALLGAIRSSAERRGQARQQEQLEREARIARISRL